MVIVPYTCQQGTINRNVNERVDEFVFCNHNFELRKIIMAKRSLAELTEQFKGKTSEGGGGNATWKLFFNFWKADMDTVSTVRFLPDLDEENPMGFLVENLAHELVINGKREKVPCLKMYGQECPICALSQDYYDEKSPNHNEQLGKKYYRKKSYIGQVIVMESPIEHDQEQLVKLIEFGPAVFKQIQAAFQSGDLEEAPFELKGGYNFRIKKTKSGEYASYTTSSFAPKQTDVGDDVIEKLNLFNLADYRTPAISRDQMEAMLVADQTGGTYGDAPAAAAKPASGLALNKKPAATPKGEDVAPADEGTESVTTGIQAPTETGGEKKLSVVEQLRARAAAAKAAQAE